ncbi:hypothetical protein ACN47E_003433 [Coniothyrium glycines]
MYSSFLLGAICGFAPLILAQSITSTPSQVPLMTATEPAVTMAWNDKPTDAAAQASSLNSDLQSLISSATMAGGMTMSDGSVMPASAMNGMPSGTAMAGMNMTAAAHRIDVAAGVRGLGVAATGFGVGVGVVIAML